jgi:organic hydroperoxide reductase OsmC/OhrA
MSTSASEPAVAEFAVTIEQEQDFEFKVRFDQPQFPEWLLDEPAPLGRDAGPNAARVLAAAIGNCLSASLLFCARKAKVNTGPIRTKVRATIVRNERGRLRIGKVDVAIGLDISEAEKAKAMRCRGLFEDYCLVTESVRHGIDVQVSVPALDGAAGQP